jgi:hypothetical protein
MRGMATFTTTLLVLVAATSAYADELVWDNYPGDLLQDVTYNMSSERNTQVIERTWVVDDVDLLQTPFAEVDPDLIRITGIEWVGARNPGSDPYPFADVIVLNTNLDNGTAVEYWDLSYTYTDYDPDPNPDPHTQTYVGVIVFDEPISIPGEHFYIGARLVGGGYFEGRNHSVTSSIDETIRGRTEGQIKAALFGAPDWRPASEVWYGSDVPGSNFEFAFRLYGYAIPEPASLGLLVIGSLLLVRRR